jgi:hypothetical protein
LPSQSGFGAFSDQRPLQLSDGAERLQREHALWRGGVDWILQGTEVRALRFQLLDDAEQMPDGTGEAVEPHHHQGLAGADAVQQLRQHRTAPVRAGGVLLVDHRAAGGAQFVRLRVGVLLLGRDPGVADQAGLGGRFGVPHPSLPSARTRLVYNDGSHPQTSVCRRAHGPAGSLQHIEFTERI